MAQASPGGRRADTGSSLHCGVLEKGPEERRSTGVLNGGQECSSRMRHLSADYLIERDRGGAPCAVRALHEQWLFFTPGSHGSQGPEFCTPDAVLTGSCTLL